MMKDMIQNSVNEALIKRKEERKQRKKEREGFSSDGGNKEQRLQFFKDRVDEFESKFL